MTESPAWRPFAEYWDGRADQYDGEPQHVFASDAEKALWVQLLERICPTRPACVLDVGTGTGFLALTLAELGHVVTGVDISRGMLAQARRKALAAGLTVDFRCAPADQTGLADGAFHLVVSRHLLWNLPDPQAAVAEWVRVTRPGGVVAAFDGLFQPRAPPSRPCPLWGAPRQASWSASSRGRGYTTARTSGWMS